MKKLNYVLAGVFVLSLLLSCEKEKIDNQLFNQSKSNKVSEYVKSAIGNIASTPISNNGVVPYIIPGVNPGGNRTCEEVETAFSTSFDMCGTKLNYGDFDLDGDNEFDGNFPAGLNVVVDGNFISFNATGCISIAGESYKVGAVIVKGSNAANIYFYENGTLSDGGLAAPGGLRMVSNITFCYVECNQPEFVIAVKTMLIGEVAYSVDPTQGETLVDYYPFILGNNGKVYLNGDITKPVGNINVADTDSDGLLEVTLDNLDMPSYLFKYDTYLFVGTLSDFYATPTHFDFPYHISANPAVSSVTLDLPF